MHDEGAMPQLRVGCSGWNYTSWKGPFYPADLPSSEWLDYYTRRFDTVEVNNTFYRLPEESTFTAWRGETPAGFLMAIKASRFLTHMKRLRDPDEPLDRLFSRVAALGPRLGPVLYQLPGNFPSDHKRLEAFLDALPVRLTPRGPRLQHVIEFRHPSWYTRDTFEMLEDHGVALCLHDMVGSAISEERVGPLCYVRFHGASGRYRGSYDNATLSRWARRLAARWRAGADTYIYFNNDTNAMAPRNAMTLRGALKRACLGGESSAPGHEPSSTSCAIGRRREPADQGPPEMTKAASSRRAAGRSRIAPR